MIPAAIAAMMGVGAYFGNATATPAEASDILLANAEALAEDENDGYYYVKHIDYPTGPGCNCVGKGNEKCCW